MREAYDLSGDRNLDPRNTMDPRWPLLPICPRFRPCSSVRGSFPNPIISVRRAGGGEKEDYLDSRDFLDNRNKEGIGIFFLFLFRCLVLDRIRWWDFFSRVIWKNVKFIIRIDKLYLFYIFLRNFWFQRCKYVLNLLLDLSIHNVRRRSAMLSDESEWVWSWNSCSCKKENTWTGRIEGLQTISKNSRNLSAYRRP